MRLIDADVLPEISLFGTTEYINVKKAPTVKAIPLDKVKQIRAEIHNLDDINPDYPMDRRIHVSKWEVLEIIDKLIKSEE